MMTEMACEKTVVAVCYCHEVKRLDSFISWLAYFVILMQNKYR